MSSNSPKNRTILHSSKNEFVRFLGEFEDTKKSFQNYLTFRELRDYLNGLGTHYILYSDGTYSTWGASPCLQYWTINFNSNTPSTKRSNNYRHWKRGHNIGHEAKCWPGHCPFTWNFNRISSGNLFSWRPWHLEIVQLIKRSKVMNFLKYLLVNTMYYISNIWYVSVLGNSL